MIEFKTLQEAWADLLKFSPEIARADEDIREAFKASFFAGAFAGIEVFKSIIINEPKTEIDEACERVIQEVIDKHKDLTMN